MYFFPTKVGAEVAGMIVASFIVAFKDFVNLFTKSASDAQHADTTNKLIDGLANSSPISPSQLNLEK